MCDWLYVKHEIKLTHIRKLFVALGKFCDRNQLTNQVHNNNALLFPATIIPAIFAIAALYADCDETLVAIFLIIAITGQGFDAAGLIMNSIDLTPNYGGALNAVVQIMYSAAAILAPYSIGLLTPNVS